MPPTRQKQERILAGMNLVLDAELPHYLSQHTWLRMRVGPPIATLLALARALHEYGMRPSLVPCGWGGELSRPLSHVATPTCSNGLVVLLAIAVWADASAACCRVSKFVRARLTQPSHAPPGQS